ncbi:erythromycin esterase family protein [Dyadobacter sp. CY312]|uniref:erythromycin esterase family protein n=1 Tax=Dyadobacter sp. CY312 TaxID=2907303 RepID=UPI001F2FEA91|nr:erythromycin esterase family protein [Dyadobacter sp. CY312]MCE7042442.1 erythromycin esterase family protein [Dyadobacter sp. CY312]
MKFYSVTISAILLFLFLSCGSITCHAQSLEEVLSQNAITIDPGFLAGDEQQIKKTGGMIDFGRYDVLAIGEQSHGTSEFFKARTSFLKMLAGKKLVTKIGLEAPMAEMEKLNGYMAGNGKDLKNILKSFRLYGYECVEFAELIDAVKKINEEREQKITFFGFDMQSPFGALENMLDYSVKNNIEAADSLKKLIGYYHLLSDQVYEHNFSAEDFAELNTLSEHIINQFPAEGKRFEILNKNIANYKQFLTLNDPGITEWDGEKLSLVRDSLMAVNVLNEMTENNKIIILAHNAHVQKQPSMYSKSMGYFLSNKMANRYKVLGITTSSGFYTATNPEAGKIVDNNVVIAPDDKAFEYYFTRTKKPLFFLKTAPVINKTKNLKLPTQYRLLPTGFTDKQFVPGNALLDFDFILHIDVTKGNGSFYLK